MKLSVIMPVYNEKEYINQIIAKVQASPVDKEIIIVDDCSNDGTADILKHIKADNIKILFHSRNKGKAGAIRTGQKHVTGDIVIIQDADMEYDPDDYSMLMRPIEQGRVSAVYGNRFHKGFVKGMNARQKLGNGVMTAMLNMVTGKRLKDMETCYKTVRSDIFSQIDIESKGFGIDPEITIKVLRKSGRILEMPIRYYPRTYNQGKKIGYRDAVRTMYTIFKYGVWSLS